MKCVLAISGGVDSVVLLDVFVRSAEHEIIVAHYDHGIRPESAADARFVAGLCQKYNVSFETERGELGESASEESARNKRYKFLKRITKKHDAQLVTAHHLDDLVETIAINLTRGTGWRGLCGMSDPSICRPLIGKTKQWIYDYALEHRLEWVEDETNATGRYLRNRLRSKTKQIDLATKQKIYDLRNQQLEVATEINREAQRLVTSSRYFLIMIDDAIALELLRVSLDAKNISLTRPRMHQILHRIKSAQPGSTIEAGSQCSVQFTKREFIVKHPW